MSSFKKKRRLSMRRKRTLDPSIVIDYKNIDVLKRFITDRGKIIPRRISGATAKQQRLITQSVKRARFLSLIPFAVAHKQERSLHELVTSFSSSYDNRAAAAHPAPRRDRDTGRDDEGDDDSDSDEN
jgi:small subunit ribosomal protein S18